MVFNLPKETNQERNLISFGILAFPIKLESWSVLRSLLNHISKIKALTEKSSNLPDIKHPLNLEYLEVLQVCYCQVSSSFDFRALKGKIPIVKAAI